MLVIQEKLAENRRKDEQIATKDRQLATKDEQIATKDRPPKMNRYHSELASKDAQFNQLQVTMETRLQVWYLLCSYMHSTLGGTLFS